VRGATFGVWSVLESRPLRPGRASAGEGVQHRFSGLVDKFRIWEYLARLKTISPFRYWANEGLELS
jgi:hypothetical protein